MPFMRFIGWDHHLTHFLENQDKLDLILSLQKAPGLEESHLSRLTTVVEAYIRLGIQICEEGEQSFMLRRILVHSKNIPNTTGR